VLAYATKPAATLPKDKIILANLFGRGDKDMHTARRTFETALIRPVLALSAATIQACYGPKNT
jgi:hypothetical protein